jgi:phage terminase large subunit
MQRKVVVLPMAGIEEGIKAARLLWPKCYFDTIKTARLLECLKRYRREVNQATQEPGAPRHDEFSHGADGWRYVGQAVDLMKNTFDDALGDFKNRTRSWR